MPSTSEIILEALAARIEAAVPAGVAFDRNAFRLNEIPPAGLVQQQDGDPGEPEVLLSPLTYIYAHRAEIDVLVDIADDAARDAAFDAIKIAIGTALAADRTFGGLCDWVEGEAPAPLDLRIPGAAGLKAATIGVVLHYATTDPLT